MFLLPPLRPALLRGAAAAVVALAGAIGQIGCATYANWPAIDQDVAVNDPNVAPLPGLGRLAVERVLELDAEAGDLPDAWVVNFPEGMRRSVAREMLGMIEARTGYSGGLLVGDPGSGAAPVYSITRIWLRGDRARVDIVRPVLVASPRGGSTILDAAFQRVTVRFELQAFGPRWAVDSVRIWPVGTEEEPVLYGWPAELIPDEAIDGPADEEADRQLPADAGRPA